jgi:hypothetical protein
MTAIRTSTIALAMCCLLAGGAAAQEKGKKLYCCNENGHKTCGDTLPPGASDLARSEISAASGLHTGEVARALTAEERAAAAVAAQQAQASADAEAARVRRDLAMIESYASEDDLRRAYGERISLLDDAVKASVLGEANLRASLTSLLNQAGDLELAGKPVPPTILANLRSQHLELQKQQRILAAQRRDRAGLDDELGDALTRYRALKQPTAAAPPAPTPAPGG